MGMAVPSRTPVSLFRAIGRSARVGLWSEEQVTRWDAELNAPNTCTSYTPGPAGYTDYPALGLSAP
jgi:hypothetical protein